MKVLTTLAVLFLATHLAAGPKPHDWKTGKVIKQTISSYNGGTVALPIGVNVVAVPIVRRSNEVILEVDGYRMTLLESSENSVVVLTVNADVRFYKDGEWFVFLDSKNKKHKFSLQAMEKLP